jgi:hypothetical protein
VLVLGAFFLNQIRFSKLKLGDGHWTKLRNHGGYGWSQLSGIENVFNFFFFTLLFSNQ